MRRLVPGEAVAIGLVATALVADVALIHRGDDPISTAVRRTVLARVVVVGLAAHLLFTIPHDPLAWAGARLTAAFQR